MSFLCSKWSRVFSSHSEKKPKSFLWCIACSLVWYIQFHPLLLPFLTLSQLLWPFCDSSHTQVHPWLRAFEHLQFSSLGCFSSVTHVSHSPPPSDHGPAISLSVLIALFKMPSSLSAWHSIFPLHYLSPVTYYLSYLFYVSFTRTSTSWKLSYLSTLIYCCV